MKINWKQKLTSRKFWLALIGFITAIAIFLNIETGTIEQVTAIIMAFATLISYILAEGFIDAQREGNKEEKDRIQ